MELTRLEKKAILSMIGYLQENGDIYQFEDEADIIEALKEKIEFELKVNV